MTSSKAQGSNNVLHGDSQRQRGWHSDKHTQRSYYVAVLHFAYFAGGGRPLARAALLRSGIDPTAAVSLLPKELPANFPDPCSVFKKVPTRVEFAQLPIM